MYHAKAKEEHQSSNAVLDGANVPAEPADYSAMSTEGLRLMLGERHLQQTGNRRELILRLQQNAQQRPPASQSAGASSNSCRVCRNLIYYSTQHEGPPVRGPLFEPGMGYFFHARFFQTSFVEWLFCFAQNLQTLVTILIYKNFFGP